MRRLMTTHKVGALGMLALLASTIGMAQPKLEIMEGRKFDLSTIPRGIVVTHQLTLKNSGSEALRLGPIEASCGCTGAIASDENLKPGATTSLTITFNSRNFTGQVHKTVSIRTTPAIDPPLLIEFTATIIDEITLQPQQLWFKDAQIGRTSRMTVTITNNGKEPLRLTSWHSALGGMVLTLPTSPVEPGKSAEIVAEFTPQKVNPILSDAVFVNTSNPNRAELYLPVYGNAKEFKFE
jgi:hypothetical protein